MDLRRAVGDDYQRWQMNGLLLILLHGVAAGETALELWINQSITHLFNHSSLANSNFHGLDHENCRIEFYCAA
jgi:hypothetical protein